MILMIWPQAETNGERKTETPCAVVSALQLISLAKMLFSILYYLFIFSQLLHHRFGALDL